MLDPVDAADGVTYDREHITRWLRGGGRTSPQTGAPLASSELRANHALKAVVASYVELREDAEKQWKDVEASMKQYMGHVGRKLEHNERQVRELQLRIRLMQGQIGPLKPSKQRPAYAFSAETASGDAKPPSLMLSAARAADTVPEVDADGWACVWVQLDQGVSGGGGGRWACSPRRTCPTEPGVGR